MLQVLDLGMVTCQPLLRIWRSTLAVVFCGATQIATGFNQMVSSKRKRSPNQSAMDPQPSSP